MASDLKLALVVSDSRKAQAGATVTTVPLVSIAFRCVKICAFGLT